MTSTELRRGLGVVTLLLAAACSREPTPAPHPSSVEPSTGFASEETTITIRGSAFFLDAVQTQDRAESRVEGTFRVWLGDVELGAVEWGDEATLRARVSPGLPPGRYDVTVENAFGTGRVAQVFELLAGTPGALRAALSCPATVAVGQELTVIVDVDNAGDALVADATPALAGVDPAVVELVATTAAPEDLAAGSRWSFRWTYRAIAPGELPLDVGVTGTDPRTGGAVVAAPVAARVTVQRPAALVAVARADRQDASVGQSIGVTVDVTNGGPAAVRQVSVAPVVPGFLALSGVAPPPRDLAAGETASFAYTFAAVGAGAGALAFDAAGEDAVFGSATAAPRAVTQPVTVNVSAALAAAATATPGQVSAGQTVVVTLAVENQGGTAAVLSPSVTLLGTAVLVSTAVPGGTRLEAGGRAVFTWTFRAVASGQVSFAARVDGTDAVSGAGLAAAATAGPITVQAPAFLTATATATPGEVSAGQTVELVLAVTNTGGAVADVAPTLAVTGSAAVSVVSAPPSSAARLQPGETATFRWLLVAASPGDATATATAVATDVNSGAPVGASAAAAVRVDVPARLDADLIASPDPVNEGQELVVRLRVRNTGEATALDVAPGPLALSGTGTARLASGPTATPVAGSSPASAVAGGSVTWFEWRYVALVRGTLAFSGGASGLDALSGAPVVAPAAASASIHVQRPAVLSVGLSTAPARVNVGQTFPCRLDVSNPGEATALALTADVRLAPDASAAPGDPPAAVDLPGGTSTIVSRWFTASAVGNVTISTALTAADATDGRALTASAPGASLVIERPAALSATLSLPPSISPGEIAVTMTVVNDGDADATGVLPGPLVVQPTTTADVTLVSSPTDAISISGGQAATFTWLLRANAVGTLQVGASASAVDVNDGAMRTAIAVSPLAPAAQDWARVIATDPFGDGSRFAFVMGYRGLLYVGPSGTGMGVVRMQFDGTAPATLGLSFPKDTIGSNMSTNQATPTPYASIGYTGCATNSLANACGPDNEDGRGLLTSVVLGGEEWLVLGGARSNGDLDYVYLTRDVSPLSFSFVDLSLLLGAATRGFSAALSWGGRLYLGFPDNGGNRPYGLALLTTPTPPGLNAAVGTNAIDLNLSEAFKKALGPYASIAIVDTITEMNGRLYFMNNIGCIVSTISAPATKDDFVGCSPPVSAAYDPKGSVQPIRQYDLEPSERAWPQAAVWKGRLYAIRNTYTGPQLWSCDPALGASTVVCEPGDWSMVAADAAYRTRLGKSGATAATLLVVTPKHLWVGFDDAGSGIHVFRTAVDHPTSAADFTGRDGCVAGTAGCDGIGGDGMGDPSALTRIFDANAIAAPDGTTDLYLTAGDGAVPVRVIRVAD